MSKLLEEAECWLSCLASSYERLYRVVGWEGEGWRRVFLCFPPLCVHLAVYDYSPQRYWGTSTPSAGHPWTDLLSFPCIWQSSLPQDLHYCLKSRVWSYKVSWLGLCWEFRSDYPKPPNGTMWGWWHSWSFLQRPRDASCCPQWELCMGRAGMGSGAPAVAVARNYSPCHSNLLEQPHR